MKHLLKNLSVKDYAIFALFFVLALTFSSLPGLIDNSRDLVPDTELQPLHIVLPSGVGFVLSMPLVPVAIALARLAGAVGVPVTATSHIGLIPWLTAILYSAILAFILAKYNSSRAK